MTYHAAVLVLLFLTPMEAVQMKGAHVSLKETSEWAQQKHALQDELLKPASSVVEVNKTSKALEKALQDSEVKQYDAATLHAKMFAQSLADVLADKTHMAAPRCHEDCDNSNATQPTAVMEREQKQTDAVAKPAMALKKAQEKYAKKALDHMQPFQAYAKSEAEQLKKLITNRGVSKELRERAAKSLQKIQAGVSGAEAFAKMVEEQKKQKGPETKAMRKKTTHQKAFVTTTREFMY